MNQTSSMSSSKEQPSSPLLGLPRELRDKIYRCVLVHDKTIHASCPDCGHLLDIIHELYGGCDGIAAKMHPATKIPDLQVLLVNSQIHAEAVEILYKENTFKFEASRSEAMMRASGLKEKLCTTKEFSFLIRFLQARTMLKKLHLTLVGSAWDKEGLQKMLNNSAVKVMEQVSIEVEITELDIREGHFPKWLSKFTQEDTAFCAFAEELGWSLVKQTTVRMEEGWWSQTRRDNTKGITQTGAQVTTWNAKRINAEGALRL